jgi:hypothetical protein
LAALISVAAVSATVFSILQMISTRYGYGINSVSIQVTKEKDGWHESAKDFEMVLKVCLRYNPPFTMFLTVTSS